LFGIDKKFCHNDYGNLAARKTQQNAERGKRVKIRINRTVVMVFIVTAMNEPYTTDRRKLLLNKTKTIGIYRY